jgi:hypothetical protein
MILQGTSHASLLKTAFRWQPARRSVRCRRRWSAGVGRAEPRPADTVMMLGPHPPVCLSSIVVGAAHRGGQHTDGVFDNININLLWFS